MPRISFRSIWLQSIVCLAVIVGVVAGDVTIAQARVAADHKRTALRKLHRAEAAYVAQVDALSRQLFVTVQPVQNALDALDISKPQYVAASRDSVVNSRTSSAVKSLDARVMKLQPTTTFHAQHAALHAALKTMTDQLTILERAKKSKDATDMLDEPYSGAAYKLSEAEDAWQKQLVALDTATHRAEAPSPGSIGSKRPHAKLAPTKAGWIFGADSSCETGAHALYLLKDPGDSASAATVAKFDDRYAAILAKVDTTLRKLALPAADAKYLRGTIYKALKANDALVHSAHTAATANRSQNFSLFADAVREQHLALKGLSTLSHDMTAYGAEHCGWYFDPHGSSKTSGSGSSGSLSA